MASNFDIGAAAATLVFSFLPSSKAANLLDVLMEPSSLVILLSGVAALGFVVVRRIKTELFK